MTGVRHAPLSLAAVALVSLVVAPSAEAQPAPAVRPSAPVVRPSAPAVKPSTPAVKPSAPTKPGAAPARPRAPVAKPPPARPPARPAPKRPVPPPPLGLLPSVARVRVEDEGASIVVTHDVLLPRGEWTGEDLDFHVAFGVPGVPLAFDARLLPVADGALDPAPQERGEVAPWALAPRRPVSAHGLLGRPTSAGVVVHLSRAALENAFAPGKMATLRLRARHAAPAPDADGARGILARLGVVGGVPLTLGTVTFRSTGPATRVEARLCGDAADATPLAVALEPGVAASPPARDPGGVAPVLSVRHATDDLCVRFWRAP